MLRKGLAENGTRAIRFRAEDGPGGDIIVPFDQGRDGAGFGDCLCIERPDGIGGGGAMRVDQKWCACIVGLFSVAA